jgi:hypothetical protein
MSKFQSARSPSVTANQLCQVGLTNTGNYTNLINSYGSIFVSQYISSVQSAAAPTTTFASGRKKRQSSSYSFTCSDLTTMGSGISSLTAAQLSTISTNQFSLCQTLLGLASNSWSSSQLSALASIALSVNINYFLIFIYLY